MDLSSNTDCSDTLFPRLRQLIATALNLDNPDQVPDTAIITSLGVDSIGVLEVLMRVENEFEIVIDDADLGPMLMDSLSNLANYVVARRGCEPFASS
jgi:acyl carrier protein